MTLIYSNFPDNIKQVQRREQFIASSAGPQAILELFKIPFVASFQTPIYSFLLGERTTSYLLNVFPAAQGELSGVQDSRFNPNTSQTNSDGYCQDFKFYAHMTKRELMLNSVNHINNSSFLFTPGRDMNNSRSIFTTGRVKDNKQQLINTLDVSQIGMIGEKDIIQKFKQFNFVVKVAYVPGQPSLKNIIFPDKESAKQAHDIQESICFNLTWRAHLPTRRNHWKFEALTRLDIFDRSSRPYQIVSELKKGPVVTVDKIKYLGARIVDVENEGIVVV
jgi:hypothetical protein